MQESISTVSMAISEVFELVGTCFDSFDCWSLIFGMIITMLIYRLVLAPVVGGFFRAGQSDMARSVYKSARSPRIGKESDDLNG